ncbi:glycosyltransferase family 2 protein [Candidatus Dependentiae bacterium]|nr:glycosyltransferase family 2 protein [Candidatus Dependentiae bacterium]
MSLPLVSIVVPLYNEESNLPALYDRLSRVASELKEFYNFEFLLVNDGSRDESWRTIAALAKHDNRIRGISFSRNFGKELAITAGYDHAVGDAIITMDSDLQHPPEFIPKLLSAWVEGFDIVYTRNAEHYESRFKKVAAFLHYKLLDAVSSVHIPSYVQDFRLTDKKVIEVLRHSREKARYLRGMVAWTGFSYTCIDVLYEKRFKGTSAFSFIQLLKISFDGLTGFSLFPLRIASYIGVFVIATGSAMLAYLSVRAFLFAPLHYWLFKCLVAIIYIFLGVLFILVWLLGEYIGRIYEEIKGRPLYVVANTVNMQDNGAERTLPLVNYKKPFSRENCTC